MAATENLKVKITADASQAKTEISKLKSNLKQTTSEVGNATSKMSGLTAGISKAAVAVGVLVAAIKLIKKAITNVIKAAEVGDKIKDDAQKVFMSTTAYQEWGYVLKQNGVEISTLKTAMRQFAPKVAASDATLKKYGITATDVNEAFEQAVYTIQNMTNETDKVAAATELFGSRALELMPVLNATNTETQNLMQTYRMLGGTLSDEYIAASDTLSDSITALKAAWGGLGATIAQTVMPAITKVVQWLTILIAKIRIFLVTVFGIKQTFGSDSKKNSIAGASMSTAKSTGGTAKNLGKAAKNANKLKTTLMGIDELSRLAEKATSSGGGGGGGGSIGGLSTLGDIDTSGIDVLTDDETLGKLQKFEEWCQKIRQGWENFKAFDEAFDWEYIKQKAREGWEYIKQKAIDAWEGLKKTKAWQGIEQAVQIKFPTWSSLKGSWEALKKKFGDISLGFKLKFSAAVQDLKNWVNTNVIDKINSKFKKVPILKNHLIPRLASGGILTAPTTAILGEYAGARSNPEIATPQSLMYETMQRANGDLVAAFATMTRQVIAAIEGKDLSVNIGDEQIARSAQRGNTAYYNRTGKALLTI